MLLKIYVLVFVLATGKGCKWKPGTIGEVSHYPGITDRSECVRYCLGIFGSIGTSWIAADQDPCSCFNREGGVSNNELTIVHQVTCGEFFELQEVPIGKTTEIRIVLEFSEKSTATFEISASDILGSLEESNRWLIDGDIDGLRPQASILKSDVTKQFNVFKESKDSNWDKIAVPYYLKFKIGDFGMQTEKIWFNAIEESDDEISITIQALKLLATTKQNNLNVNWTDVLNNEHFDVYLELTTMEESTADIQNLTVVLQPQPGLALNEITFSENNIDYRQKIVESNQQLISYRRLYFDSSIKLMVRYKINKDLLVGNSSMALLATLDYTKFDNGEEIRVVSSHLMTVFFERPPTNDVVLWDKKYPSTPNKTSYVTNETKLYFCHTGGTGRTHCGFIALNNKAFHSIPRPMAQVTGVRGSDLYGTSIRGNKLKFNENEGLVVINDDRFAEVRADPNFKPAPKFVDPATVTVGTDSYTVTNEGVKGATDFNIAF